MPEVKDKATGKTIAKMDYDPAGKMAAEKWLQKILDMKLMIEA